MIQHTVTLQYGTVTDVSPDIKLVFNNAGHILGSATVHLHIGEGVHNIVYTGDYKYGRTQLFDSASWNYPRVETLITEGTYGNKEDIMPPREEVEMNFVNAINRTLSEGGKVIIPIPAVGRAQEIILVLDHYMRNKVLTEAPVFLEGMISEATAIHVSYADYLSRELRTKMLEQGINPFVSEYFTSIEHPSGREEALREGPAVIMATSGMLEGGPVLQYFEHVAPSERNKILFVSYQVQGTLGRRVLDGAHQASLLGDNGKIKIVDVRCQVQKVEGFSGHSDYNQIIQVHRKDEAEAAAGHSQPRREEEAREPRLRDPEDLQGPDPETGRPGSNQALLGEGASPDADPGGSDHDPLLAEPRDVPADRGRELVELLDRPLELLDVLLRERRHPENHYDLASRRPPGSSECRRGSSAAAPSAGSRCPSPGASVSSLKPDSNYYCHR